MATQSIDWTWEQLADTAAVLYSTNPILKNGQVGFETNTFLFKKGDGVTRWNDLAYAVVQNQQSVWVGLSSTPGNLLSRAMDGGFVLLPNKFPTKDTFVEAVTQSAGESDYDTTFPILASTHRTGVMLRRIIDALGASFAELKQGNGPYQDMTVEERILQVASNSVTITQVIKDTVTGTGSTWSSSKIDTWVTSLVNQKIATLVGDAPEVLDTIYKLAAALGENQNLVTTIAADLANTVRFNTSQNLNDSQKSQARTNIGAASAAFVGNELDITPDNSFVSMVNEGRATIVSVSHPWIIPAIA